VPDVLLLLDLTQIGSALLELLGISTLELLGISTLELLGVSTLELLGVIGTTELLELISNTEDEESSNPLLCPLTTSCSFDEFEQEAARKIINVRKRKIFFILPHWLFIEYAIQEIENFCRIATIHVLPPSDFIKFHFIVRAHTLDLVVHCL